MTDFQRLIGALADAEVEFIIVGGLAATAHGSARLTQDVDVVYSRSPENLSRLVAALSPLNPYLRGAPPGLPFEWGASALKRGLNFTLTTTAGDIDLLGVPWGGAVRARRPSNRRRSRAPSRPRPRANRPSTPSRRRPGCAWRAAATRSSSAAARA